MGDGRLIRRWEFAVACASAAASVASLFALHRTYVASVFATFGACWIAALAARSRPALNRLLSRLLLIQSPRHSRRLDRIVLAEWAALMSALVLVATPSWRNPPPLSPIYDEQERTTLNLAVARAKCGSTSSLSDDVDVAARLSSHPQETRTPLGALATFSCASIHPMVIGENSLMLIEAASLWLSPDASLATLARVLMAIEVLGVALFVTALTITGVPPVPCALLMIAIAMYVDALQPQYAYSMYPLMIPCVVGFIGVLTLISAPRSWPLRMAVAVGIGVLLAGIGNLRTDLYGICGVLAGVWVIARSRLRKNWFADSGGIVVGAIIFTIVWIRPIERTVPQRLTRHPIMHPLVLSLGSPPDHPLARRFGIRWNDEVAFALAHRLQPGVQQLTPEYEAVLGRFYVQLWREHRAEMLSLYRSKFLAAARSFVVDTSGIGFDGQLWRSILRPLGGHGSSGWLVPTFLATAAFVGVVNIRRWPASWLMPLTLLVIAGAMNWLEAAILMSHFALQYYGPAFTALLACCVALYQFGLNLAWWPMSRSVLPQS